MTPQERAATAQETPMTADLTELTPLEARIDALLHHLQADGSLDRSALAEGLRECRAALAQRPVEVAPAEALQQAIKWFDEYAALHRSKGTPDGNDKAQRNQDRADFLRAALAQRPVEEDWRTRFWQIVDGEGLLGLPSDEWNALARLVRAYAERQPAPAEALRRVAMAMAAHAGHPNWEAMPATATHWSSVRSLTQEYFLDFATAALSALQPSAPGWVLVPKEPTIDMANAAVGISLSGATHVVPFDQTKGAFTQHHNHAVQFEEAVKIYRAMLAAAPEKDTDRCRIQ